MITDDRALIDPALGAYIAGDDAPSARVKEPPELVTYLVGRPEAVA